MEWMPFPYRIKVVHFNELRTIRYSRNTLTERTLGVEKT